MSLSDAAVKSADSSGVYPPLDVPKPSPQIGMNDPEFEDLTTAEKLNDGNYRELVYEAYPNEPTCACEPAEDPSGGPSEDESLVRETSRNLLVCRSGCERVCCSSVRQPGVASSRRESANRDDKMPPFRPSYCVANLRENECVKSTDRDEDGKRSVRNGVYRDGVNRLRGGGEGGERRGRGAHPDSSGRVNGTMGRGSDDAWNGPRGCVAERRLEGGSGVDYEYAERRPMKRIPGSGATRRCYTEDDPATGDPGGTYTERAEDSRRDAGNPGRWPNACAPRSDPFGSVAAGCCCPDRAILAREAGERENGGVCARKPCPGVDCLIKAFRETQVFVESLGKVPGLAGLGLMDPADSPYFGRDKPIEALREGTKATTTFVDSTALPNRQCVGPCNPRTPKTAVGGGGDPFFGAAAFTIAVPGRGGVVREAVPAMPGAGFAYAPGKSRRRDDRPKEMDASSAPPVDVETGPCGEPECRAKRRRNEVPESASAEVSAEVPTRKLAALASTNGAGNSKTGGKRSASLKTRSGRRSSLRGPGGDRVGTKRSSGRSLRRAVRFVYSAGDEYAGLTCGHKNCIEERRRVPGNMGWLWNLNETVGRLKPRPGWKPGAIGRHLSEVLREAKRLGGHKSRTKSRTSSSSRSRSRSAPSRGKRAKVHKDGGSVKKSQRRKKEDEKEEIEPPPTLHIHRKDGTYYVTMYPIKQDTMNIPKLEEPMKPLQFKIAKNKDDASIASSSTASDMEIEFSPPAAVNRYHKKPNVVHVETQVKQQEIIDVFKGDYDKKADKKKGKKGKK